MASIVNPMLNAGANVRPRDERSGATLCSVGTATPELCWSREDTASALAHLWNLRGDALARWNRIVVGSGIDKRHGVLAPDAVAPMTTGERMAAFERLAPPLATQAAVKALQRSAVAPNAITDIVVVSCTGMYAPGLDVDLIERLGLPAQTRRTMIGFMGCFGAINGLRVAAGLCAADPNAAVLLVCVELCSLHVRASDEVQNQVASALFADGAAAAVLTGRAFARSGPVNGQPGDDRRSLRIGQIGETASLVLPEGRDWMTWRITDAGFAMTLTRDVPPALRRNIAGFVERLDAGDQATYIVHPGGPGVFEAVDGALGLHGGRGIECARRVLRTFGNMSSATALFVLEDALRHGLAAPMTLLAFGPGLTIEGLNVLSDAAGPLE